MGHGGTGSEDKFGDGNQEYCQFGHAQVEMLARHMRGEVQWANQSGFQGQEVQGQDDPPPSQFHLAPSAPGYGHLP